MATIKNTRDIGLQSRGVNYRIMKPSISIGVSSSPAGYSYFSKPANTTTISPASLTLVVLDSLSPGNYSVPVYNWEYSTSADPVTWISLGVNTLGLTITNTNFVNYVGTGNFVNVRLTVSQTGWSTLTQIFVVEYYRTVSIIPVVSLSRSDLILPISTLGTINYTGTGTNIRVSINNIYIPYDVAATAGPNTFTVTAVGSTTPNTVTVGAATTTTTSVTNDTRTFADISGVNATINPGNIVYTITVRDVDGTASVFTRTQSVVVSLTGANAKTLGITADSYIFKSDSNNTLISSVIKLTANKQNTTNTVSWSLTPAISLYSAATGGSIVTTGDIVYLRSADYGSNTSTIVTATISADSLSDTCSILRVRDGSSAITAVLSNPVMPLPTTAAGVVTYTGSGSTLQVYEGSTLRTITAVSNIATNITAGTTSGLNTTTVTIGDHLAITQDNAKIVYTATITKGDGTSGTIDVIQSLTKSKAGANGTSNITISAFRWVTGAAPTATGTATFTWSTKTYNTPPTSWTSAADAAPGTGYTLYQVNLIVSDVSTATTTAINWANGVVSTIGYRNDGSIGLTGASHRTAYVVTTSGTVPGSVTAGTGDVAPINVVNNLYVWDFNATSNLSAGQYMYQVDGTYTNGANIVWGNPYLSNLKVGSLSALSADLGTVSISSTGSLASKDPNSPYLATKTFGSSQSGFFLGYDSTNYKFDVGNNTKYIRWDGSNINIASPGFTLINGVAKLSGELNIGAFTGYFWPGDPVNSPTPGVGAHIGPSGFLIGNYRGIDGGGPGRLLTHGIPDGKYFQIAIGNTAGSEAAIYTNIPAYLADLQVTTLKINDNAITYSSAVSTFFHTFTVHPPSTLMIVAKCAVETEGNALMALAITATDSAPSTFDPATFLDNSGVGGGGRLTLFSVSLAGVHTVPTDSYPVRTLRIWIAGGSPSNVVNYRITVLEVQK